MPLCKFSLIVTFIFYAYNLFPSFSGKDCLKSSFNIEVSHKGPPLGLFNNKLRIDKKDCVLIIEKEKFRYLRSKWELDVCRFPIHIKEGAGAINVHKKVRPSCDFSSENKDKFCIPLQIPRIGFFFLMKYFKSIFSSLSLGIFFPKSSPPVKIKP